MDKSLMSSSNAQALLAQLQDIHLPEAVGKWPLAPGWYVLIVLCLLVILGGGIYLRSRYLSAGAKRQALHLLALYQLQYQQGASLQHISAQLGELLRRVALVYFPRVEVAGLQGEKWLTFLNHSAKGIDFYSVRRELLELPYHPQPQVNTLDLLFHLVKTWIKQRRKPCLN